MPPTNLPELSPASASMSDDELMMRVQAADPAAFSLIVERYQSSLIGFLFRNTRDIQLAEDIAQETLLRVFNQAWDYLPRNKFRGWVFQIARNLLIDTVRRHSHDVLVNAVKSGPDDDNGALARMVGDGVSPELQAGQRELREIVGELLDEIPETQRLTFTLHHYAELSLAEVAEVMETNVPTTKSRLRLAREKLQEKLLARGFSEHLPTQPDDEP